MLWVMLNPGIGETEKQRRNTLERCIRWSREWGHGGLLFGNVFTVRTNSARALLAHPQEVDQMNLDALKMLRSLASEAIVAWGSSVRNPLLVGTIIGILGEAKCLGHTQQGQPRHPLHVANSVTPEPWIPGARTAETTDHS